MLGWFKTSKFSCAETNINELFYCSVEKGLKQLKLFFSDVSKFLKNVESSPSAFVEYLVISSLPPSGQNNVA